MLVDGFQVPRKGPGFVLPVRESGKNRNDSWTSGWNWPYCIFLCDAHQVKKHQNSFILRLRNDQRIEITLGVELFRIQVGIFVIEDWRFFNRFCLKCKTALQIPAKRIYSAQSGSKGIGGYRGLF